MKQLITTLRQMLPLRHLLLVGGLLIVVVVILWWQDDASTDKQLAPPPLPQLAVPADNGQPSSAASIKLGHSLKLADHRPDLSKPGLQYLEKAKNQSSSITDRKPTKAVKPRPKKPAKTVESRRPAKRHEPPERPPVATPKKPATVKPQTKVTTRPQAKPSRVKQQRSTGLFAALPANAWLLQVATAGNQQRANAVCAELTSPCVAYAAARNGKSVWVVVVGPYSNRQAAINGKKALPRAMQDKGPFPRKVSDVRQDAQ